MEPLRAIQDLTRYMIVRSANAALKTVLTAHSAVAQLDHWLTSLPVQLYGMVKAL
jgi:hypothetical protein